MSQRQISTNFKSIYSPSISTPVRYIEINEPLPSNQSFNLSVSSSALSHSKSLIPTNHVQKLIELNIYGMGHNKNVIELHECAQTYLILGNIRLLYSMTTGIPLNRVWLVHNGHCMHGQNDLETMNSFGIKDGDRLDLIMPFKTTTDIPTQTKTKTRGTKRQRHQ